VARSFAVVAHAAARQWCDAMRASGARTAALAAAPANAKTPGMPNDTREKP